MAAQGRKKVNKKTGVRFKAGYTSAKYNNMLRNVVTELEKNKKLIEIASNTKDEKTQVAIREIIVK